MRSRKLVATISMLGMLLPAASFAQGNQPQSQSQQRQQQQGQQQTLDKAERRQIEERLKSSGYNPGPVDGVFTGETARALVAYERARHTLGGAAHHHRRAHPPGADG
jgi:transcription initiation factor TFIID subunit TAF12